MFTAPGSLGRKKVNAHTVKTIYYDPLSTSGHDDDVGLCVFRCRADMLGTMSAVVIMTT